MKKLLSLILAIVLMLSAFPFAVSAAGETDPLLDGDIVFIEGDDSTLTIDNVVVKKYNSSGSAVTSSSSVISLASATVGRGDVNGDGKVSITDMIMIKAHILGKSKIAAERLTAADMNGDGKITITDFIQNKADVLYITLPTTVAITKQPVSTSAKNGAVVTVEVAAVGDGLTYKWFYKNLGDKDFSAASNFTSNSYSVEMADAVNGRQLYCLITDKYGNSVKSSVVTLTKTVPVAITVQPKSVSGKKGELVTASFTAVGDGLTYSWYYKDAGAAEFVYTNSFSGNTYRIEMNEARNGRQVYCVVKDKYGETVRTNTITLSMKDNITITEQPISASGKSGTNLIVSFVAEGEGLIYKWFYKDKGDTDFTQATGFTGTSYNLKISAATDGRQVYAEVTDKKGNKSKTTTVTLSMLPPVKITLQPSPLTVNKGETATIKLTAVGEGLTYKWYYKDVNQTADTLAKDFVSNSYSVEMSAAVNGRVVYCVVTDKYGDSVTSSKVKLTLGNTLAITKQPTGVTVSCGTKATVSFTATGDGLTYKWYYKDASAPEFVLDKNFIGTSYEATINAAQSGRQVYATVTDKHGSVVTTDTVTLTVKHVSDGGVITKAPTCTKPGEKVTTCKICNTKTTEVLLATGHKLGQWKVWREATTSLEGVERATCANCSYYKDRSTAKLVSTHYITVDLGFGEPYKVGVSSNNKYSLSIPKREGYVFAGWKDSKGKTFAASGTVTANTSIHATWTIDETDTLIKLIKRAEAGAEMIKITADIIVDQPIYITYNTTIYSDGDFTIQRAPEYTGDIFVVGTDKYYDASLLYGRYSILTLGGGEGTLTIDGNRDNVTKDVVGSLVFVSDSATVNIYDGVKLVNNKKVGNDRIFKTVKYVSETTLRRAGGAAILNIDGTINMYGGLIDNNLVVTELTTVTNEDGTESSVEIAGNGAGIYNRGNLHMYGGLISNNEALRGGGVYNERVAYLVSGEISSNLSHTYGGGVSSSSSSNADTFIGSENGSSKMIFKKNHSLRAGGVLYSNTTSPIVILGNTEFIENSTDSSGGVIYTAGALTVRGAIFIGNTCKYSGGAIFHQYSNVEYTRRRFELTDCVFENNSARLGGAVTLSASTTVADGTVATITNCRFTGNHAFVDAEGNGNGGAIYITRKSDATIKGCTFDSNLADNCSGAVSVHAGATLQLSDSTFTSNKGTTGGAMYITSDSTVNAKNVEFRGNSATKNANGGGGHGGAIHIYTAKLTLNNVDFYNNTAENNAGAIYQGDCEISVDSSCEFVGNSAGNHGGAFYLTYKTLEDGTKSGSKLTATDVTFKDNTATAGGAISARTACEAVLNNVKLIGNKIVSTEEETLGGGAVYVGFGTLTLNNVTATGNIAVGNGGAVSASASTVTVTGGDFSNNEGLSGSALQTISNSIVKIDGTTFNNNRATDTSINNKLGGAVNVQGGSLDMTNVTMDGNSSGYYGGAVHTRKAAVKIKNSSFTNSEAATGAALYLRDSNDITIEDSSVTNNTAKSNGVIYLTNATASIRNVAATGNTASSGGVLYVSSAASEITVTDCDWNSNSAKNGGVVYLTDAALTIKDCNFESNSSTLGGAIFNKNGKLKTNNTKFYTNSASSNGGAVTMTGGEYITSETDEFIGNTADNHAGAIYVSYLNLEVEGENGTETVRVPSILTANGGLFKNNTALGGGAISIRSDSIANIIGSTFEANTVTGFDGTKLDGNAEGGGAIYVGYGELNLTDAIIKNNSAEMFGGAVAAVDSKVTATGGSFENNIAGTGGAIHSISGSDINLKDTSFKNNEANYVNTEYDGNKGGGAITALGGGSLVLSNVTLDANKSAYYGGTILATKAVVEIKDNSIISNSQGGTGGALSLKSGSTITISDITIKDNTATKNGVIHINGSTFTVSNVTATGNTGSNGGVFFISGGTTQGTIKDSDLTGNTANYGGVACIENASVEFDNVEIYENSAKNGGAVHTTSGNVLVKNSRLYNNTANLGGAVYNSSGSLIVENVAFTNNAATLTEQGTQGNGGAVYNAGGITTVTGETTFTSNTAGNHGGAVYVSYITDDETKTKIGGIFNITGGLFENNSALAGGAISSRTACEVTATGTEFKSNSATSVKNDEGGGAIFTNSNTLTLSGVTMDGNSTGYYGGAITALSADVTIKDNSVIKNSIGKTGAALQFRSGSYTLTDVSVVDNVKAEDAYGNGVIYATGTGTLDITNLTATGNSSSNGGVIYLSGSINTTITKSNITGNTAKGTGGAIDNRSSGTLAVTETTFKNNTAKTGGAIYLDGGTNAVVTNCEFDSNITTGNGGAIAKLDSADYGVELGTLTISGSKFTSNEAYDGGAVYAKVTDVTLVDNLFEGNKAANHGGAVDILGSTATATGNNIFKNNTAGNHGGAIYVVYTNIALDAEGAQKQNYISTLNMTGGIFEGNTALGGGAASARTGCELNFNGTTFDGNTAQDSVLDPDGAETADGNGEGGGAIYVGFGKLNLTDATFNNNAAINHGGAIASVDSTVIATGGDFDGNTASIGGAVNAVNGSALSFTGTTFKSNESTHNNTGFDGNKGGGAISAKGGSLTLSGVTIDSNKSNYYGGAILANGVTVEIKENSLVTGNIGKTGSALHFRGGSTATLSDTEISDNKDAYNGVVYINGGSINMTNVTASGNSASKGGVLYVSGSSTTVTLENSNFAENTATYGGAVYVDKATVTLNGTSFTDNIATKHGGAIAIDHGADATITGGTYHHNSASSNGGAIAVIDTDDEATKATALLITDAIFTENSANIGGAVYSANGAVTFDGGEVSTNSSTGTGGAVFVNGESLGIKGTTFNANTSGSNGGAVYVALATVTLEDAEFTGNTANSNGGAIDLVGCTATATGDNKFSDNTAGNHGGAIYVVYTEIDVQVDETTTEKQKLGTVLNMTGGLFENNSALAGGAISSRTACEVTATGTEFKSNSATSVKNDEGGGAIFTNSNTLTLSGVTMDGNSTGYYGGAITALSADVTIKDNSVIKNSIGKTGAAFNFRSGSYTLTDVSVVDNVKAEDAYGNGVIYATGTGTLDITNLTATGNSSSNGGVIYLSGSINATIADSELICNTATGFGGAIDHRSSGSLTITGSTISDNTANMGGAINTAATSTVTIEDSEITGNTSTTVGGAINHTSSGELTINGTTVAGNSATESGGAIYTNKGNLTVFGGSFNTNSAADGGAITLDLGALATITDTVFDGNNVTASGGAIAIVDSTEDESSSASVLTLTNTTFKNNTAKNGAAVYSANGAVTFDGGEVSTNSATGTGGAVYVNGESLGIKETVFASNSSGYNGGAVYAHLATVTLEDAEFTGNTATNHGGAIDLAGCTATATGDNKFTGNTAANHGGAIYVVYTEIDVQVNETTTEKQKLGTVLDMTGGTFENNTALGGGAVSARTDCEVNFNGTTFTGNTTAGCTDGKVDGNGEGGGAIYVGFGSANLVNTTFTSNTSENHGGAVDLYASTMTVSDSRFEGNTASTGGAIYTASSTSTLTVENSNFIGNSCEGNGGAINISAATVTITGGKFNNNFATLGGAVYNYKGILEVDGVTLTENSATNNGGAIGIAGATLTVVGDTKFVGNTAGNHGGAVYVSYTTNSDESKKPGIFNITGGLFENNSALAGGAISSRTACEVTATGTEFKSNSATSVKNDEGGGAIFTNSNTLTLSGVTMDGNSTGYYGGAITALSADVTIKDNSVIKNSIGKTGAALQFRGSGTYTLTDVEVTNNIATSGSGVIYITGDGDMNITNLTATGNQNNNGAVLYCSGSGIVTVKDSDLSGNTAITNGGAVDVRGSTTLVISGTTISGNTAKIGGAINTAATSTVTIEDSEITDNTSTTVGGAINHTSSGELTINGTTVAGNSATESGGAIYANKGGLIVSGGSFGTNSSVFGGAIVLDLGASATITDTVFDANNVTTSGGAIAIVDSTEDESSSASVLTLTNTTFKNNTAKNGAAVYSANGAVTFDGGEVSTNSATGAGGAVYVNGESLGIKGTTFNANTSGGNGGAVYVALATVTLEDAEFTGNTANSNGGAIDLVGCTATATGDNKFSDNTAGNHGGAIYVVYTEVKTQVDEATVTTERFNTTLDMTGGSFEGNKAFGGGAVSIRTGCEATFNGTIFDSNSVQDSVLDSDGVETADGDGEGGGAIYVGFGKLNLTDTTFNNNTATNCGGAIDSLDSVVTVTGGSFEGNTAARGGAVYSISGSTLTFTGTTFKSNESTYVQVSPFDSSKGGGAISTKGGSLTMSGVTLDSNKTGYYGGAILASSATVLMTDNCLITGNSGATGAAISFRSCNVTMTDATIEKNISTGNGNIYINGGTSVLTNITATENTSATGGVFYISGATTNVTIDGGSYEGNTSNNGGVAYLDSSTVEIKNATMKGNSAKKGGAITVEKGAKLTITDSTFDGNSTTSGDGGAILVADSTSDADKATTLIMNGVTLKNNIAASKGKGGALSTDTGSPLLTIKVTDCIFEGNSASEAGGGAVEIQNGNCKAVEDPTECLIVFTRCTFTGNSSKTTGGAIEIRTSSCAKIDGITATNNKASGNGAVIYVTSDYSRVYLTGDVTLDGNTTSSSGTFAYLYNNGSYTYQPKIITTHSNTATWVSEVKGNVNIAYDLTTLP